MRDLIKFVWRGALGGAIVPLLLSTYYLIVIFGTPLFWVYLISSPFLAIPGAIVGVILWICSLFFDRLGIVLRVTIGVAINSMFLVLEWLRSSESFSYDPSYLRRFIFWSTSYLLIGGMAGWLCPAAATWRREPEPPYWERVRQYEAAQAEHDFGKAQLDRESTEKTVAEPDSNW
ncbi:MAG: hypothetical protein ABJA18_10095 [bacterium]